MKDDVLGCEQLVVTFTVRTPAGVKTVEAVKGVDVEVLPGQVVGIVGESGSGKTTVARALAGLQPPTAGRVCCAGTELGRGRASHKIVGRHLGMIFQDPRSSLNSRLTVASVIADPLVVQRRGDRAARRARVAELLDAVGLPAGAARRRVNTLSGGQQQRVAIARALCLDPAFVVADEPTSALDVSVQSQILNLLRELRRAHGFGMLLISHDMRVMRALTDELLVMLEGEIVERGPTASVFEAPQHDYTRTLIDATPLLSSSR